MHCKHKTWALKSQSVLQIDVRQNLNLVIQDSRREPQVFLTREFCHPQLIMLSTPKVNNAAQADLLSTHTIMYTARVYSKCMHRHRQQKESAQKVPEVISETVYRPLVIIFTPRISQDTDKSAPRAAIKQTLAFPSLDGMVGLA